MAEDKLFYVGQKAFIEKNGEVLVLNDPVLGLDFPGGKIQEDEIDFDLALKREVKEETDLEIEIGLPFTRWSYLLRHGHSHAGKTIYLIGFRCKYVSGNIKLSHEHDGFNWVNKENYREFENSTEYFKALEKYFEGS